MISVFDQLHFWG